MCTIGEVNDESNVKQVAASCDCILCMFDEDEESNWMRRRA